MYQQNVLLEVLHVGKKIHIQNDRGQNKIILFNEKSCPSFL